MGVLDISTARLHANLPEGHKYFLRKPLYGLGADGDCECYEAMKAVYGLRVAPRAFQEHFVMKVTKQNFRRSVADPQIFIGIERFDGSFMTVWVDDVLII